LTTAGAIGHGPPVSDVGTGGGHGHGLGRDEDGRPRDPTKRHRHDVGAVDHGARTTEPITRGIQGVLGLAILGTLGLTVYAIVLAAAG
jgi:hypothetical protein